MKKVLLIVVWAAIIAFFVTTNLLKNQAAHDFSWEQVFSWENIRSTFIVLGIIGAVIGSFHYIFRKK